MSQFIIDTLLINGNIYVCGEPDADQMGSGPDQHGSSDRDPEMPAAIFDDIVPNPLSDPDEKKRIMLDAFHDMVSRGLTAVHTYAAKIWNYEEDVDLYRSLERSGQLPLRVLVNLDEPFEPEERPFRKDPFQKSGTGSYK